MVPSQSANVCLTDIHNKGILEREKSVFGTLFNLNKDFFTCSPELAILCVLGKTLNYSTNSVSNWILNCAEDLWEDQRYSEPLRVTAWLAVSS